MHVLILGATSAIAAAVAREFAAQGADITLAARNEADMAEQATDLKVRHGVTVHTRAFDALDMESHKDFVADLPQMPDVAVLAFGTMADQDICQQHQQTARTVIDVNFTGAASVLEALAAPMERRGTGGIIGISSVAGLRGRASNYAYGAAKAGLTTWLSGMRNRLTKSGVHVMTVLPGFVDTPMTEGMALPALLTASPQQAARDIVKGWEKKRNVVYTKGIWRWIMLIIRLLPEAVFKRTSL